MPIRILLDMAVMLEIGFGMVLGMISKVNPRIETEHTQSFKLQFASALPYTLYYEA